MYGLVLENLSQYICRQYGTEKWEEIRKLANIEHPTFSSHKIYPDNYVSKLASAANQVVGVSEQEILYNVGVSFVSFVGRYGYDRILNVLGRNFRDFLNGLDNLHEYLRFSYPKIKPPSFFCADENAHGLTLHYRSKRKDFLWYTIGQIKEVGQYFYETDVIIEVLSEEHRDDESHFVLLLIFDNRAFITVSPSKMLVANVSDLSETQMSMMPIKANIFLQIFPFCIVFNTQLVIKAVGVCLQVVLPHITNRTLPSVFNLVKPKISYSWMSISGHTNTIFELTSVKPLKGSSNYYSRRFSPEFNTLPGEKIDQTIDKLNNDGLKYLLRLKGQMLYLEDWNCMVYLAAPNIDDLEAMMHTGLYLNDLSLHDFSRDMVLAGQQQSAELQLALDQELHKTKQLEESMHKLDIEMKRTDELLYQMRIADRLRRGEKAVNTCQYFQCVTILFSDIVNFTGISSQITPMQVVNMLNSMYSLFDQLTERHFVYKVETIGDAYMIAGGLPVHDGQDDVNHAHKVCEMAQDMISVVAHLKDPSNGKNLNIRIGAVVGGIVGLKMPRYCLFGDTVNTASRIESTSEAQMVQISEMTKNMLDLNAWNVFERGTIQLKGKGLVKTHWLYGRRNDDSPLNNDLIRDILLDSQSLTENLNNHLEITELKEAKIIDRHNSNANQALPEVSVDRVKQLMQIELSNDTNNITNNHNAVNYNDNSVNCLVKSSSVFNKRPEQQSFINRSGEAATVIINLLPQYDKAVELVNHSYDNNVREVNGEEDDDDGGCFSCNGQREKTDRSSDNKSCKII